MNEVIIRKMQEEDIASLSELYKDFWNETSDIDKMLFKFNNLNTNDNYIFLSAIIDNKLVGSIVGIVCHELYGECEPFLVMEDLVVKKSYRNTGIGKKLLTRLEELGKNIGCTQIQFITEDDRKETITFYEKAGYDVSSHRGFKKKLKHAAYPREPGVRTGQEQGPDLGRPE